MSTAGTPSTDPWIIVPRERIRYEEQFRSLKPINNVITGDQAKGFFLQSQLPPPILGHIWALADTDADGKMDIDEFSIACKLINLRLRGFEIPKVVPPNLLASLQSFAQPNIIPAPNLVNVSSISNNIIQSQQPLNNFVVTAPPVMPASIVSPLSVNVMSTTNKPVPVPVPIQPPTSHISPLGTETSNTPRASITSLEKTMSIESPINDWVIPHHTKLKYTQIFNANDKTRSGFLTGVQARNIMVHTKLPQNILAQIWSLADMDCDGRLGCEEFILAMYLCEQASLGNAIPSKLPIDLIPISFRRGNRNLSISSQGSVSLEDPASTLLQSTFEDKRKENFEKGQAELERRRKTLLDQQRKEAEERERKEREEMERKEKAKQEAEKKRLEELERQMREQQEQERLKEEERKRQSEQKEAARREMERQRQLEWEKQRLLELQQQRQREQENVLKLKAKNQSLTIELSTLNEQIKDLSQKICDTRLGVSNVKTTIDGMRTTRDIHMQEQNQLKQKLKEQNNKLLALSQEKVKLDSKIKSSYRNEDDKSQINFDNKDIILRNLKEKVEDLQSEIDTKLTDIENNNTHLTDLKSQLKNLLNECESMYGIYKDKKDKVLEIKSLSRTHNYNSDWRTTDNWQTTNEKTTNWPVENDDEIIKYKALYEFVARNTDEISFQPGDIINVPKKQVGEPGWLAGEIRGHTGWFPESYVESLIDNTIDHNIITQQEIIQAARLEEITEEINEISIVPTAETILNEESNNTLEYYVANYPYQSQEQGDLTFNAGEIIQVIKKDGEWWTGKIGNTIGIFPSNYVQRTDMVANDTINDTKTIATDIMSDTITSDNMNQMDNEVSQINELRMIGKPIDQSATNTQTLKGKKPEIASVIAPYQATSAEQLSLARGQLIMIRKKTDSGWWEGELQAKGRKRQVGWFPASYVKVLNSSGRVSGRTTPVSTTRMQQDIIIDKVIALFSYTAGNPDELSFSKDDIISVTARDEEAWWKGELNGITGFFPSNYVAPLQQSHCLEGFLGLHFGKTCMQYIKELINTEKKYVDDLTIVHEVFEKPLKQSKIINERDLDNIFLNWSSILKCNRQFLKALQDWKSNNLNSITIGNIIANQMENMDVYKEFCEKQLDSVNLLKVLMEKNREFGDMVKRCQNNYLNRGMPFSFYLIKPFQRITKYPLLINKIIENIPDNDYDCVILKEALNKLEQLLNEINENIRNKENQTRCDWLQKHLQNNLNIIFSSKTNKLGPRKILYFGILNKLKNGKTLISVLFNDFLLFIQPSKNIEKPFLFEISNSNNNITYKIYKQPILIQDLIISHDYSICQKTDLSSNLLKIHDNKNNFTVILSTDSTNDFNMWFKKVQEAKQVFNNINNYSTQSVINKTQYTREKLYGRLLILVQKTKDFFKTDNNHYDDVYCKAVLGNQTEYSTIVSKDNFNFPNEDNNSSSQIPCNNMQFHLININDDLLKFFVYGKNLYCPDEFLGETTILISQIYNELQNTNGPILKKLKLHSIESAGEILIKLDLHLFHN